MSAPRARISIVVVSAAFMGVAFAACMEPPPKIESIPPGGLALRLHVFGASAKEAHQVFDSVKQTNKSFALVREGGDGEVLVGLENDSPKCVAPTALCSFNVAVRIKNNAGKVVHLAVMPIAAHSERCADLCEKALNEMVVKVIDLAVAKLKSGDSADGGATDGEAPTAEAVDAAPEPPAKKAASKPDKSKDGKDSKDKDSKSSTLCSVAHGPPLPTHEAERRAAQVEVLHRINVLDQAEYDCLRKAYLDRL